MENESKKPQVYLAADFGAGSGRLIGGWLSEGCLNQEEIHRFPNRQVRLGDHLYWDFPALFQDLKDGMKRAAEKGWNVRSIGIDTWGVDFGLIRKGNLLALPVCYRDERTKGMMEKVFARLDRAKHYATTGIQQMEINTLFQLAALQDTDEELLHAADHLLFMPDLFSYFLTGEAQCEYTIASTSELLDARRRTWSEETLRSLHLPEKIFGKIIQPGTVRGKLKADIAEETGLGQIDVVAVGSHDTASAVCATPLSEGSLFLSSGTWSLLGAELDEPILSPEAMQAELTNEGGIGGKIRFLQNITGLWLLRRYMEELSSEADATYDTLLAEAAATEIESVFPPEDSRFNNPPLMSAAIVEYCTETNQRIPQTRGEFVKTILLSLATKYAEAVSHLARLLPFCVKSINVIGGGSQNALLNQLTANLTKLPVLAGPVEATGMGNILVQAMCAGEVKDLAHIRQVVRRSVQPKTYLPE